MQELTKQQAKILAWIVIFERDNGMPPTRREISKRFKFKSHNSAKCHLVALEKRGAIQLTEGAHRGIKVLI